jgi:hypothetical protein
LVRFFDEHRVNTGGQREVCSPVREVVRAEMLRRWDASNGWDRGEGVSVVRVQ